VSTSWDECLQLLASVRVQDVPVPLPMAKAAWAHTNKAMMTVLRDFDELLSQKLVDRGIVVASAVHSLEIS
jgi:hypothetical protein